MAFIQPDDQIIHTMITDLGYKLLNSNNERFIVSHVAFGDDEINYNLVDNNDENYTAIQALPVTEPTKRATNQLQSRLIRFADNLEQLAKQSQYKYVPENEIRVITQIDSSPVFSLENWFNDELVISFALKHPTTLNYFLSEAFIINLTEFYTKFGVLFDFIPISPTGALGTANKYWYIADQTIIDASSNVLPVVIGIDSDHRPSDGVILSSLTNDLQIPILTFKLKLRENQVQSIYRYMRLNEITALTADITIGNNDKLVTPISEFYGQNKSYTNILTKISLTITF